MDPLLSLLMANLGRVEENSLVIDPFVGTGSLLVAAALMGGFVFGTDIDFLMLHGRTRPTRANQVSMSVSSILIIIIRFMLSKFYPGEVPG
jgi:tRNA (guanine10-N2)-methyltransferase